jgi:hypothetical protein
MKAFFPPVITLICSTVSGTELQLTFSSFALVEGRLKSWQRFYRLRHQIMATVIAIIAKKKKLQGFSSPANYTDRATAACRRS